MKDIDIARKAKLEEISKITEKLKIEDEDIEKYGRYKAKVNLKLLEKMKDCLLYTSDAADEL